MLNLLISILLSFSSTARPHLNPINLYSTETADEDYGKWDASGGNSGGPIYVYDNSAGYCLVGILSDGSSDNALIKYTQGVRIDTWLYNTIVSFRYAEE